MNSCRTSRPGFAGASLSAPTSNPPRPQPVPGTHVPPETPQPEAGRLRAHLPRAWATLAWLTVASAGWLLAPGLRAQPAGFIAITNAAGYTQNFDGMGSGASATNTPPGWYVGTGTGAISGTNVVVSNGNSSTDGSYNFGTTAAADRALGSLVAVSSQRNTEVRFVNLSGLSIASFTITYSGEQWRQGGGANSENNDLVLQFSTTGTAFTPMGAGFNFSTPQDSGTAGALDGNQPTNRVTGIGGTYTPAALLTNGQVFYLRWTDADNSSLDHGLGIDDLTITFTLSNPPPTVVTLPASGIGPTNATLPGTVNPGGLVSAGWFQWGTTTNYGNTTAPISLPATNVALSVSNLLTGLNPSTFHHFRLVATNSAGTNYGADFLFATAGTNVTNGFIAVRGPSGYSENFDIMGAGTGATNPPAGWYVGGGTSGISGTEVSVGDGNSSASSHYNFGSSGQGDRALGIVSGGSSQWNQEARFVNLSGAFLTSFNVSYTGEQWRQGAFLVTANQEMTLSFSTNGTNFAALGAPFNFNSPQDSGSVGALDGNLVANRVTGLGGVHVPSTPIARGQTFYLRWSVIGGSGNHGMAIDDLSVTFTLSNPPLPVVTLPASEITLSNAVLNGSLVPNDLDSVCWFQWGTTTNYGNNTAPISVPATNGLVIVSNLLAGLAPSTIYHCRIAATNAANTSYGADIAFATGATNVTNGFITLLGPSGYSENFDIMGAGAGATNTPPGWYVGTGTGAISGTNVLVGNGGANTDGNYNFGAPGGADRALGSLVAGTNPRNLELRLVNVSGLNIASFTIAYTGEQWRLAGPNAENNDLVLQFSTNGSSFTALGAAFNFNSPLDSGPQGPLDGNLAPNRVTGLGGTYTPATPIGHGQAFYLRWVDVDNASSDHGMAIDDFSITLTFTNPPPAVVTLAASELTAGSARLRGTVNPGGAATTAWFQWGTTTNYGSETLATNLSATNVDVAVSQLLTLLPSGNTFHCRAVASNQAGVRYGGDVTFATLRTNAYLSALTLSAALLSPGFNPTTTNYAATVAGGTTSVLVTPTSADPTATIQVRVNGGGFFSVPSGSASPPLTLFSGLNLIDIRVTAQDGVSILTYTLAITRTNLPNTLLSIVATPGQHVPFLGPRRGFGYGTATLDPNLNTLSFNNVVCENLSSPLLEVRLHGPAAPGSNGAFLYPLGSLIRPVSSNWVLSGQIPLIEGVAGFSSAQQRAQLESGLWYLEFGSIPFPDGEIRGQLIPEPTTNALLSALSPAAGLLAPPFQSNITSYILSVPDNSPTLTLTPTSADPAATIQVRVNGGVFASVIPHSPTAPLPLNSGSNAVEILVTASDAITTQVYLLTVHRLGPVLGTLPSANGLVLFWPTSAAGFGPESATNLGPGAVWNPILSPPVLQGPVYLLTNSTGADRRFYRLKK